MKLTDARFKWTSGAACLEGTTIDTIYFTIYKNNKLHISNGNLELPIEVDALKNIFSPYNCEWNDIEFEEVKVVKESKLLK